MRVVLGSCKTIPVRQLRASFSKDLSSFNTKLPCTNMIPPSFKQLQVLFWGYWVVFLKEIKVSNNIWPFHVLDLYCTISCTRSNVRHCKRNVFHIVWWASQLGGVEVIEAYLSSDMQVTSIWHSF